MTDLGERVVPHSETQASTMIFSHPRFQIANSTAGNTYFVHILHNYSSVFYEST